MDMADWNFVPFVRELVCAARFSPRAIAGADLVKRPGGMSIASDVCWTRRTHPALARLFGS
jgi:hypothetical protein